MTIVSALLAGLVFGIGLIVSGMSDPSKVLGFLDLAGRWNPSLALVMAAAVTVALPAFGWAGRRTRSILGEPMQLPPAGRAVDRRLLVGAALFGVGWGVAGLCPGPALVVLGMAEPKAVSRFVQEDPELKAIPVVAVTAFAMKGDEERIRQGGCEAYLSKPISVGKFIETVRRFIG